MKNRTPSPAPFLIVKRTTDHEGKPVLLRQGVARTAEEVRRLIARVRNEVENQTFGGLLAKKKPATYEVWQAEWSFVREDKPKG